MTDSPVYFYVLEWLIGGGIIVLTVVSCFLWRQVRRARVQIETMSHELSFKKKALEDKKQSEKELLTPFGSLSSKSVILSVNPQGILTGINDAGLDLFGYTRDELLGQSVVGRLVCPTVAQKETLPLGILSRIFQNPRLFGEYEMEHTTKSGDKIWISWTNRVTYDAENKPVTLHAVGFDITKRKVLENKLNRLSRQDSLTGILNQQAFLEVGALETERSCLYQRQLSVIVLQLSLFCDMTQAETEGFSDTLITTVIRVCQENLHKTDTIARIGDVNFALLLPETPYENALFLADQLKRKIQQISLSDNSNHFLSLVFGVAEKGATETNFDNLLAQAIDDLESKTKKNCKGKKKG